MRLRSYQSHVARARDPRLFKEAAIRSAERSESMTIDRIDVGVLKPDETDRETLLGLAYASWDAYHPFPTNDTKWYTLDGFDWNAPFGWEPEEDGLRGHLFMSPDNSTALVTFKGTTVSGNGLQDSLASSSKKDKYNDNLLCSCCCADVLFARMDHPCHCSLGGNRCSNVCLTASLLSEHSYYAQATVVMSKFVAMYPDTTNWWATGHSLGGGLASLVGQTFGFPTVTFESIPERLAAERLHLVTSNTMSHEVPVVHVYNDADPIAMGTCNGPWSFCTRAGFAFESKCRTGKSIVYNTSSTSARDKLVRLNDTLAMTLKGRPNPVAAHRLAYILSVLQDETREVPVARVQGECQVCQTHVIRLIIPDKIAGLWVVVLWRVPGTSGPRRSSGIQDMVDHMEKQYCGCSQ
ncbi:Alpha/Beta hydrolase protein [Cantharellus anzutake]|uniref:Alpha/Beta hydrolase protein n=1 Tax=Cantharellus anzutake TaxID=1750568 RepID=UPI001905864F|nr:Alpha/Beta hydrolase protein [Cantharellus anzutake]KAF8333153.1 Alpha/Beta hydrolase protein [Cantharellus anzutake]